LNLYVFVGNDSINKTDFLGLILGDTSENYLVVLAGRWVDPRALWENVTAGDAFRVASAYSYHVLKAPVDLVEGLYRLPAFFDSIPELAELARSGELKCLLGAKWDDFWRAPPEEQMEILGGLMGSAAGTWATGVEGLNLIKALRAARTARTLEVAEGAASVTQPVVKGFGNIGGGATTAENALGQAQKWLGEGYKEIAPGVYRSADNARQFRMTVSDLTDLKQGPHVHFEAIGSDGRTIIENSHVGIRNP
jgi:hypothetical protein